METEVFEIEFVPRRLSCNDEPTLDMLASSQIKMNQDSRISGLFRQYCVELAQVPDDTK